MCEIIERNRREAAAEAAEKAAAEARAKALAEGEAKGKVETVVSSIKNLMETMNLTAEQAMVALKVPAGDYAKYMLMV